MRTKRRHPILKRARGCVAAGALGLIGTFALIGATHKAPWLDAKSLATWNRSGAAIPMAPKPIDSDLASGGRCSAERRPPSTPEDRAVVHKGWWLVGPYQRFGRTSLFLATSSADGMCRPNGYQGFVFFNAVFAGTLSPTLMDSRTDASISGAGATLYNERTFSVTFERYSQSDALCCPHASTSVSYKIEPIGTSNVVEAVSATTSR